jgi:putative CocE/NonD family hydrolase
MTLTGKATAGVYELGLGVSVERCVPIPTRDGTLISADIYWPRETDLSLPALLNCTPYRKDDLDARSDRCNQVYFASRGFVAVKLDVRGTGSSEGIATDEYTETEQADYVDVTRWVSEQPWCNGQVGAWGLSYSGFNVLQLAANQPPALRAIAFVGATDDRYTDDVHRMGGALEALELAHYQARMLAANALPAQADLNDPDVLAQWRQRIEQTPPWIIRWLNEQRDGPYWRNGSIRPDYERIMVPTMVFVGSRDGYRTASLRMVRNLSAPWTLVIGPWGHCWPDGGFPGPRYPFLEQATNWFQHHLGDESQPRPRCMFFLERFSLDRVPQHDAPGQWLASDRWGDDPEDQLKLHLTPEAGLVEHPSAETHREVALPYAVEAGLANGTWCPVMPVKLPGDQRRDEAFSLIFTSEPLSKPVGVFGEPVLRIVVSHPGPTAAFVAKLADVAPDGRSQLVTSGVLNLAHHDAIGAPKPFQGPAAIELRLLAASWEFQPGHRIRLALAGSDWPNIWPLPTTTPVSVHLEATTSLTLPLIPEDATPAELDESVVDTAAASIEGGAEVRLNSAPGWVVSYDALNGAWNVNTNDITAVLLPLEGRTVSYRRSYHASLRPGDPSSARITADTEFELETPGGSVRTRADTDFTSTQTEFVFDLKLTVGLNDKRFANKHWQGRVPRDLC